MEFSTEGLKPLAERLAHLIGSEMKQADDLTASKIEEGIRQRLRELGQMTFGLILSQQDGEPEREIDCECGGRLYYQRRRPAKVLSVFDWVAYERSYYAGCQCGQGKAPWMRVWDLHPGR